MSSRKQEKAVDGFESCLTGDLALLVGQAYHLATPLLSDKVTYLLVLTNSLLLKFELHIIVHIQSCDTI